MPESTLFAQMPSTPETIIAQVTQHVLHSLPADHATAELRIAELATTAVLDLWERPIRTFIPVLALREVQNALRTIS
jgi:hypothetical protein